MSAVASAIGACMFCSSGSVISQPQALRIYREERLAVRRRGGHKRAIGTRAPMTVPIAPNDRWSLNFVPDQLTDGRRFRIPAVVDDCTRECLAPPSSPGPSRAASLTS
jgi:putative transposase